MSDEHQNVFLTQGNEQGVDLHQNVDASELLSGGGVQDTGGAHEHVSQSTRLHHKMREMKETDDALALMKSDYADRIRAVKDGEAKFLIKQHNIIKYLRRFKLFILESDTKRARAEKKEAEEHRQRNLKVKEIEQLRAQFLQLQQTRSDLKQRNDHYKQNKQYLESVKDAVNEQYGEIDELIGRYEILKNTNTDLTEANRSVNEKMEAISGELQNLYKTKQNDILVKNSKFAHLLQKLEQVTNETSSIENEVVAVEARTRDMNRYFCEVQMAIQNIYARTMSSLPSQKAATQMKKRMQAQAAANREAETARMAQMGNNVDENSGLNMTQSVPGSRIGTAGSAMRRDSDFDSDLSDSEDPNNNNTQAAAAQPALSAAEEAAARAAAAANAKQLAAKQAQVKQHLLTRLDAILERLEDLQDIVEHVQPGALQQLRESGSLYAPGNFHHTSSSSGTGGGGGGGGGGGQYSNSANYGLSNLASGGGGYGGVAGVQSGSNTDRRRRATAAAGTNAYPTRDASESSSRGGGRNSKPPTNTHTTNSSATTRGGGSRGVRRGGHWSDSESDGEFSGLTDREEMERKFRAINSGFLASGILGAKEVEVPAHQMAIKRSAAARGPGSMLPPVKGANSNKNTPRSPTAETPRSPGPARR